MLNHGLVLRLSTAVPASVPVYYTPVEVLKSDSRKGDVSLAWCRLTRNTLRAWDLSAAQSITTSTLPTALTWTQSLLKPNTPDYSSPRTLVWNALRWKRLFTTGNQYRQRMCTAYQWYNYACPLHCGKSCISWKQTFLVCLEWRGK